jgi:3-oxoadipate enol-lactonase
LRESLGRIADETSEVFRNAGEGSNDLTERAIEQCSQEPLPQHSSNRAQFPSFDASSGQRQGSRREEPFMPNRWIEANGVQLRYELQMGPPATIVLLHEMGGMLESWDAVVPLLAPFASVLRYDQRGAGLSEKPPGPYTVAQAADDLAALLAALAITGPVAVAGAAVGAAVAVAFAARHPQTIAALALLAPATMLDETKWVRTEQRIAAIERLGIRQAFAVEAATLRSRYEELRLAADPAALAATWRMLAGLDLDADLAAIRCPSLVVAGRQDTARPPEHVASVAAKIPGAEFLVLETGHVMAIDTPELTASTLRDFLVRAGFPTAQPADGRALDH